MKSEIVIRDPDRDLDLGRAPDGDQHVIRMNPRLVFGDPDRYFGRDFYQDLLMEQQEAM